MNSDVLCNILSCEFSFFVASLLFINFIVIVAIVEELWFVWNIVSQYILSPPSVHSLL